MYLSAQQQQCFEDFKRSIPITLYLQGRRIEILSLEIQSSNMESTLLNSSCWSNTYLTAKFV